MTPSTRGRARHPRWVCVYEAYDEVTWGLIVTGA